MRNALARCAALIVLVPLAAAQHHGGGGLQPIFSSYSNNNQNVEINASFATMVPSLTQGTGITYSQVAGFELPSGLVVNSSNGQITKTSTPTPGSWTAKIKAHNAWGNDTIWVAGTFGQLPTIGSYSNASQSIEISEALVPMSPTLASGTTPVTYSEVSLPEWLAVDASTGVITKTGIPAATGNWSGSVQAQNAYGTSASFSVGGTIRKDRVDFGVNLNFLNYFSRTLPFPDLMKTAKWWYVGQNGAGNLAPIIQDDPAPGQPTGMGYPDFSQITATGGVKWASCVVTNGQKDMDDVLVLPEGTYLLRWEGNADQVTVAMTGSPSSGACTPPDPRCLQWSNVQPQAITVKIKNGDGPSGSPVRNVRFYMPNTDADADAPHSIPYDDIAGEDVRVRTPLVDKLKEAVHVDGLAKGPIRFLDWDRVNEVGGNAPDHWFVQDTFDKSRLLLTDVKQSERATDSRLLPVAYEYMIELCNQVGCDMWINVPHQEQDPASGAPPIDYAAFCDGLANLIIDRLDPELNVYVEWSNEVWNDKFRVRNWIENAIGDHTDGVYIKPEFIDYQVDQMLEMYSVMKYRFVERDADSRFRFVVMGHIGTPSYVDLLLDELGTRTVPAPLDAPFVVGTDVYGAGCSFYFRKLQDQDDPNYHAWYGPPLDGDDPPATTPQEMVAHIAETVSTTATKLDQHRDLIKPRGIKFLLYEGGVSQPTVAQAWAANWFTAQRIPEMYDLYRDVIGRLRTAEVDLGCHYAFCYKLNDAGGGVWQLIERENQSAATADGQPGYAPKYKAWVEGPLPGL
ncbi:MAG: Ig domain-containing protein [Planctomycetota bacterium]